MRRAFATRARTVVECVPTNVRSTIVVGAWLALTLLFTFGGVVLFANVSTALGHSQTLASTLLPVVGVLGAYGVSPTLARVVVAATVGRFEATVERDVDPKPDGRQPSPSATDERICCRTPCCS